MRTHNISTLTGEVYDTLAHNTDYPQFDINEYGLDDMVVDEDNGKIWILYHDKEFEITINERSK